METSTLITSHPHAQQIHHYAEGAIIEYLSHTQKYQILQQPMFYPKSTYRVQPFCDYAFQYISDLNKSLLPIYQSWLSGKTLLVEGKPFPLTDKPFESFLELPHFELSIRKPKVLWVCASLFTDGAYSFRPECFLPADKPFIELSDIQKYENAQQMIQEPWVQVPTITE